MEKRELAKFDPTAEPHDLEDGQNQRVQNQTAMAAHWGWLTGTIDVLLEEKTQAGTWDAALAIGIPSRLAKSAGSVMVPGRHRCSRQLVPAAKRPSRLRAKIWHGLPGDCPERLAEVQHPVRRRLHRSSRYCG